MNACVSYPLHVFLGPSSIEQSPNPSALYSKSINLVGIWPQCLSLSTSLSLSSTSSSSSTTTFLSHPNIKPNLLVQIKPSPDRSHVFLCLRVEWPFLASMRWVLLLGEAPVPRIHSRFSPNATRMPKLYNGYTSSLVSCYDSKDKWAGPPPVLSLCDYWQCCREAGET